MNPPGSYMGATIDWGAFWARISPYLAVLAIAIIALTVWAIRIYRSHKALCAGENAAIRRAREWAKGGAR